MVLRRNEGSVDEGLRRNEGSVDGGLRRNEGSLDGGLRRNEGGVNEFEIGDEEIWCPMSFDDNHV